MPDPPLAEQFHDLLDFADSQVRAGLRATGFFRIAGRTLKVTAPADLLAAVADPLAHLACMEAPAVITWHLFRKDTFFCRGVPARWIWEQQRYDDGRFDFRVDHLHAGITATDRLTNVSVLIAPDFDLDRWRRPESSRPALERLLSGLGLVSVHGGTIGNLTQGVLLTAPGGRGKSSLVAAGVRSGFSTTGDDFLCLEQRPSGPLLHSMYRTVKLAPDSPAWRDELASGPMSDGPDGKHMTLLDHIRPGCLVDAHLPVALVVPRVGRRVGLVQIGHRDAVTALVPSSAAMASDRARAALALSALASALPCYALTLAHDPEAELAALAQLLPVAVADYPAAERGPLT
jgi:hypothetical protein